MTEHLCGACTRPAPDSTICDTCTDHLVTEVASVGAYHGLAYDLDVAIAKQARFRSSPGGRDYTDERPVLIDERASDAARALKVVLLRWARIVHRETHPTVHGPVCRSCRHVSCQEIRRDFPVDTLSGVACWLRRRIRWMAGHVDAVQAYDQICDAVRDARIAVDRPGDRLYVGPCDCGRPLYARSGDRWAVCRDEQHEDPLMWPVDARRTWMLGEAENFVGTTTEISAALSRLARPVTPAAIRGYVFRRKLRPVWADDRGRALYRLGDVLTASTSGVTSENIAS